MGLIVREPCIIQYRNILTIPKETIFGLEHEMVNVDINKVASKVYEQLGKDWKVSTDSSLKDYKNAEISAPPLPNTEETWILLKKLQRLMLSLYPSFDNCSLQINFDGKLLPTQRAKIRFIKLFAAFEDIIYRFSKGFDKDYRFSIYSYAAPIIFKVKDYIKCEDFLVQISFKSKIFRTFI